ncbi:uncharacterized protein LOC124259303 isoform X2 [Haliotis rubra]|uniref:uncharacterized protein LOC124259303 isoform X1 n=1 Tax=Haliotis rubra TaxID=36100 RepID=UPI001EE578C4|nr:uncharacterized protein LOC124259303 isoform X1 [Haliotis rubra]XP_046549368.1 uncharacterized protein LOC124259303 isoform X2 [Haliotis rubra]
MEPCIFHTDKTGFECLRRQLQLLKVLPRHLSQRLAMAVCSCRKTRTTTINISNEEFSELKQTLKGHFNQWINTTSSSALAVACNILHTDSSPTSSEKHLLYIIDRALNGDFTLLEAEKETSRRSTVTKDAEPSCGSDNSDNAVKLTKRQIGLMVKKRKRKMPIKEGVSIPLHRNYIEPLQKVVGARFEKICQKFKCVVEVDWDATNSNMQSEVKQTKLLVWCRSSQTISDIRRYLLEILNDRRLVQNTLNMKRYSHVNGETEIVRDIVLSYQLTDHFTEKVLGRKRHRNRTWQCRQRVKSLPSVLDTMLCSRCHQPYSEVLVKDTPCNFHPGQRDESNGELIWNCCHKQSEYGDIADDHLYTGCWTGSHMWDSTSLTEALTPSSATKVPVKQRHKMNWAVVGYVKAF